MKLAAIIFLMFLGVFSSIAQKSTDEDDYDFGYVVTLNGDTLDGEVNSTGEPVADLHVKFKDKSGNKTKITSSNYKAYGVRTIDFRCIPGAMLDGNVFAEVLEDGELILYTYNKYVYNSNNKSYDKKTFYFVQKAGDPKSLEQIKRIGFKKDMLKFVGNYPVIATQVNNKDLGFYDLKEIIQEYNKRDNK